MNLSAETYHYERHEGALKVLLLDGMVVGKVELGPLDTQDFVLLEVKS